MVGFTISRPLGHRNSRSFISVCKTSPAVPETPARRLICCLRQTSKRIKDNQRLNAWKVIWWKYASISGSCLAHKTATIFILFQYTHSKVSLYCQGVKETAIVRYKTKDDKAYDLALLYTNPHHWGHLAPAVLADGLAEKGTLGWNLGSILLLSSSFGNEVNSRLKLNS